VTDYPMNYSRYLDERETRLELARAAYENQKEEIERIEGFISRFRYQASKAALVQSRIKQLERIERLPPPEGHERELKIRLPEAERSGRITLARGRAQALRRARGVWRHRSISSAGRGSPWWAPTAPADHAAQDARGRPDARRRRQDGGAQRVRIGYFAQDHAESLNSGAACSTR
jgi:ATP-binding cassette subfamily F protein 3